MRTMQAIREHYQFNDQDVEILKTLEPIVEPHTLRITDDFYHHFLKFPETAKYLKDEGQRARLQEMHREWLLALFQGNYDDRYLRRLERIGHAHVRIGLSAHYVYVAMNLIRLHLHQIIVTEVEPELRDKALRVLEKILDLNLDVIARTYHEEEIRRVFLSQRLDSALIKFSQRFTFGLNILLVLGLLGLSLGAVTMIMHDVLQITRGNLDQGLVAALGSVLILWVVIELLDMEIERLRGGAFKLHLFVGVALVAFIRKALVTSLSHPDLLLEAVYLGGILVTGVIFWLVSRAETGKRRGEA
jgi:uncharacterized membrane protein (DUF373 family)/hemoglobin-like flavoprotein